MYCESQQVKKDKTLIEDKLPARHENYFAQISNFFT